MKTLQSVMKEEESFEVIGGDVETIRSQKQAFKVCCTYDHYIFVDKAIAKFRLNNPFVYAFYSKNNNCIIFSGI